MGTEKKQKYSWGVIIFLLLLLGSSIVMISYNVTAPMLTLIVLSTILIIGFIYGFVCGIKEMIKDERKLKKFRNELKVGDKTHLGTVIEISNDVVRLDVYQNIENVYPTDNE